MKTKETLSIFDKIEKWGADRNFYGEGGATLQSQFVKLSEEVGGDATKSRSQVDDRMTITLENWAQRWDGELDLVLGEAKAHVDDRLGRVRALRTEDFLRSLTVETDNTEAPRGSSRIVDLLNKINGDFQDTARKALEFYANAPIERLLAWGAGLAVLGFLGHRFFARSRRAFADVL